MMINERNWMVAVVVAAVAIILLIAKRTYEAIRDLFTLDVHVFSSPYTLPHNNKRTHGEFCIV